MNEGISKIKLVLTDIDGVWTDGGMYYGMNGEVMKKFNTRDGMGVARLRHVGIETVIVTSEDIDIVRARAKKLVIEECHTGVKNKAQLLEVICRRLNVSNENVAYIGDDVNDLEIIKRAGFSACPNDAMAEVKAVVDYVCEADGGKGAFREFVEFIIRGFSHA